MSSEPDWIDLTIAGLREYMEPAVDALAESCGNDNDAFDAQIDALFEAYLRKMHAEHCPDAKRIAELEDVTFKLDECWMFLDAIARQDLRDRAFIIETARAMLKKQQSPGWKEDAASAPK